MSKNNENNHRYNRSKNDKKVDFEKMVQNSRLVEPKSKKDDEPLRLEDIVEPYLAFWEETYDKERQEVVKIVKKCNYAQRFDIVPLDLLLKFLANKRNIDKELELVKACPISLAMTPINFYIQIERFSDHLFLMEKWLADSVKYKKLARISEQDLDTSLFFIVRNGKETWSRAKFVEFTEEGDIKIFLVDYGIEKMTLIEFIRELPVKLMDVEPFALKCKLTGVEIEKGRKVNSELTKLFIKYFAPVYEIFMTVDNDTLDENQKRVFSVTLRENRQVQTNVNKIIMNKVKKQNETKKNNNLASTLKNDPMMPRGSEGHMNFRNDQVDIPEFNEIGVKGIRCFKFTNLITPSNFFLQINLQEITGKYKEWDKTLQVFYNNPKNIVGLELPNSRVIIKRCYVFRDDYHKDWKRIRVVNIKEDTREIIAFLVDDGNFYKVKPENMLQLVPEFAKKAALSFCCHLVDIVPPNREKRWSKEAVSEFRRMMEELDDKICFGITMDKTMDYDLADSNVYGLKIGLVLFRKNDEYTIQGYLAAKGLADACGVASGRMDFTNPMGEPNYDGIEAKKSFGLQYPTLVQEFNELILQDTSIDEKKPEFEEFEEIDYVELRRHIKNPTKEPKPKPIMKRFSRKTDNPEYRHLPDQIRERIGRFVIVNLTGPGCMYIRQYSKVESYKIMMKDLQKMSKLVPVIPPEEIKLGDIALIKSQTHDQDDELWHRCIVSEKIDKINLVKALQIDTGKEITAKYHYVKQLPKDFHDIPTFAVRVHMDPHNMKPSGIGRDWTSDASSHYTKYIIHWMKTAPAYYCWLSRPLKNAAVQLDEIGQPVVYDDKKHKWSKGPSLVSSGTTIQFINDHRREFGIISKFYYSYGIEFVYEVFTASDSPYAFKVGWDALYEHGYIQRYRK